MIWMEDTLRKYKGTIIVVSHDQNFLAEVTTDIIHLEDKKLHYYRGDFNMFKEMREQQREKQKKDYDKQEKRLKALRMLGKSSKQCREVIGTKVVRPRDYVVHFSFVTKAFEDLTPPVLEIREVCFRYGDKSPWLFKDMTFGIGTSTRAAIVGPNGVGKSTLISLIIGDLEPTSECERVICALESCMR